MTDNKDKNSSKFEGIIMGAIIGSAIGSVLGATLAPKSGKETRQAIADKSKQVYDKSKELGGKIIDTHKEQLSNLSSHAKTGSKSLLVRFLKAIFGKKNPPNPREFRGIKEIPVEGIEVNEKDRV